MRSENLKHLDTHIVRFVVYLKQIFSDYKEIAILLIMLKVILTISSGLFSGLGMLVKGIGKFSMNIITMMLPMMIQMFIMRTLNMAPAANDAGFTEFNTQNAMPDIFSAFNDFTKPEPKPEPKPNKDNDEVRFEYVDQDDQDD